MREPLPENPNQNVDYRGASLKTLYLAGGCFWGIDAYFHRVYGVAATLAGYANGNVPNPTYEMVCGGDTGFAETVKLRYDPDRVSAAQLVRQLFRIIDSTRLNRQGADVGEQYRTGVYFEDEDDLPAIEKAFEQERQKHAKPVVTELLPLKNFYPAEESHQAYLEKNPQGYCHVSFDSLVECNGR